MLTNQEIFDKVASHLFQQGKPSVSYVQGMARCKYRNEAGLKCAVGALINDEDYSSDLEFSGVDTKKIRNVLAKGGIDTEKESVIELLLELQLAHDSFGSGLRKTDAFNFQELYEQLVIVARYHGLRTEVLTNLMKSKQEN